MKQVILLGVMFFFIPLLAQETKTETYLLAETAVRLQLVKYGSDPEKSVFLNLHENESTSVLAAKEYLSGRNGYFIAVQQNGNRNISFHLKGTTFQFDPNRMFTKTGRITNLKLLNKKYTARAEETVEEFSDKIISRIRNARIVIAVHNNTNGKPLSATSYRNRYLNPAMDTDDFVLTTEKKIFDRLKAKKINTVWETTATSLDDGSLAYYCSQKKIPYINVEAQAGHKSEQVRMLKALTDIISNYTR